MVATDVASRGIGMIDQDLALPFPLFPQLTSCVPEVVLCSLQRCAPILSRSGPSQLVVFHGFHPGRSLGSQCRCSKLHLLFPSLRTLGVPRRKRARLASSSCISIALQDRID